MAEEKHHHHHHHHHVDGATLFKRNSLNAIERRKKFEKYGLWVMYGLAVFMALAVFVAYAFL